MVNILAIIVIGGLIGLLARAVVPGGDSIGCLGTIVLGIIGSFAGGFITALATSGDVTDIQPSGFVMSVVGAIVVLAILSLVTGRRR